jgi:hypothetical protein
MEEVIEKSELLRDHTIDAEIIKKLTDDSGLSESELHDFIVNKEAKFIEKNVNLLDFLYFYQFDDPQDILDNFAYILMTKYGGKFSEAGDIPTIFYDYIRTVSCVGEEGKCSGSNFNTDHIVCLKFLQNSGVYLPTYIFTHAIGKGTFRNIKKIKELGVLFNEMTFQAAVKRGDLEIIKWLAEANCPMETCAFELAASGGNLEIMQCLKYLGCPWCNLTFAEAAENGNLENMKWLREEGCPWSSVTFVAAAENGNLENMKWLREEGCPWDWRTFTEAVKRTRYDNNLENLEWLLSKNCPWNEEAIKRAMILGDQKVIDWVRQNLV